MPAASSSPDSPRSSRVLVIGESAEAAYRYASSDATDVELVVGQDGAAAPHAESYDQVIVVGFAATPDVLRTVVDRGFELAGPEGHVLVGSGAGPIADDVAAWDAAFAGLSVASVDRGTFPAVELVRSADGSAGTFLAGALTVLGLVNPRPDLKKVPRPTVVGAAPGKGAKPKARPRPSRKRALIAMARRRSKFLIVAAAGGVVALAVSMGLVALLDEYFLAILVTITLLAVMVTTIRQEQYNRQIRRQLGRVESVQSSFRKNVSVRMRQQVTEISQIQKNVGVSQLAVVDAVATLQRIQAEFKDPLKSGLLREIDHEAKRTFEQVQATINLFGMVDVNAPVPPMRGWAVSPDALNLLIQEFLDVRPALVVECGSGISTLWLGLTIKKLGLDTRVVALDHEEEYAGRTNRMLAQHGVDDIATVRYAPLTDVSTGDGSQPWYDPSATKDLDDIGLLFIDGPPKTVADLARMPALPVLWDKLAPQASIVLDDMIRQTEQDTVALWRQQHPELTAEDFPTEKGTCILRRP